MRAGVVDLVEEVDQNDGGRALEPRDRQRVPRPQRLVVGVLTVQEVVQVADADVEDGLAVRVEPDPKDLAEVRAGAARVEPLAGPGAQPPHLLDLLGPDRVTARETVLHRRKHDPADGARNGSRPHHADGLDLAAMRAGVADEDPAHGSCPSSARSFATSRSISLPAAMTSIAVW